MKIIKTTLENILLKNNDSSDNRSSYGLNWGENTKQLASEWCHEVNGIHGVSLKYADENRDLTFEWECNRHPLPWRASVSERILGGGNCPACEHENDVSENLVKKDNGKSFTNKTMTWLMASQGVETIFIDPKGESLPM